MYTAVKPAAMMPTTQRPYSSRRNAWLMISSLEKKPDNGGTPAIASHATTIATR